MMRFGAGGEFADDRDVLGNRATNCGTGAGRATPGRLRDRIDPASFKRSDETIRPGIWRRPTFGNAAVFPQFLQSRNSSISD